MWLYIPQQYHQTTLPGSHCVPASVAWNSDCISQSQGIELFVMSSETLSPRPLSWQGWRTRPWLMHLSGVTCGPSTAALGVVAFISSLPDIHASRFHSPAVGSGTQTPDTSGQKSQGSPEKSDPIGSSARMSTATCPWDWPKSSGSFQQWATQLKRACFLRLKSVRPTYGAGSSFWPTPVATLRGWNRSDIEISEKGLRFRPATDQTGKQVSLQRVARLWAMLYATMRLLGARPTGLTTYPFSRPFHLTLQAGTRSLTGDWTCNPSFLDWMMGWPIGWSEPMQSVTGWCHWLQRMRGALCALPLPRAE